jgi:hypothetical protein
MSVPENNRTSDKHILCSQEEDYEHFKSSMFSEMEDVETELSKVFK